MVGVEQQLHHLERRALGRGVVQGKLFVLRTRRAVQHWWGGAAPRELRRERGGVTTAQAAVWTRRHALSVVMAALRFALSRASTTANGAPLAAA